MISQPPIPEPLWNTVPPEAQVAILAVLDSLKGRIAELEQRVGDLEARLKCAALVDWLPGVGANAIPVAAGSPWENGSIEAFHSRLRDEFLERVEFEDVADARAKASWYRREYNAVRPHSSLGYSTPKEFSAACDKKGMSHRSII